MIEPNGTSARAEAPLATRTSGTVRVVGSGLLGASVGHALTALGVDVVLSDTSPSQLRLAIDYGAGRAERDDDRPSLIVVAVPPDVVADVVERELAAYPDAVVTDVASIKLEPLRTLRARGVDLTHYIGSHPMAGRERGGAISARADIFVGRPWVVCRDSDTSAHDLSLVEGLAHDLGATLIEMTPEEHDESVALMSHVPQLVASLLAGRFVSAPDGSLRLAGQGVRDTTRIAASAPELWVQILGANAAPVVEVLDELAADLSTVAAALRDPDARGARRAVADTIRRATRAWSVCLASTARTVGSTPSSSWSTTPPAARPPLRRVGRARRQRRRPASRALAGGPLRPGRDQCRPRRRPPSRRRAPATRMADCEHHP